MLIKASDGRASDIGALERIIGRQDLSSSVRRDADEELRKIRAGAKGERDAAFEIEGTFGRSKNFIATFAGERNSVRLAM